MRKFSGSPLADPGGNKEIQSGKKLGNRYADSEIETGITISASSGLR